MLPWLPPPASLPKQPLQATSLLLPAPPGAHDLAMEDAGIHEFNLMEVSAMCAGARLLLASRKRCLVVRSA